MNKKKIKRNTSGFQEDVKVEGTSNTDKDMKDRLAKHQKEIDKFLSEHPYLNCKRIFDYEID